MANTKEVRKQIASIKSTQKITSAMEMVAASKMKKTQDTMLEGRPYSLKIKDVISHVALANSEYPHPFYDCLLYTSPSPRDERLSRMPSSA